MSDWREQYGRMLRWRRQLDRLTQGRTMGRDEHLEHLRDLLYAFFQTCHHMQDWFANDPWNPVPRADVETYVHTSRPLSICRDLCNGSKHARLEAKGANLREEHKVTDVQAIYTAGEEVGKVVHLEPTFALLYGDQPMNPFDLADECVAAWDAFIEARSLNSLLW
jgi:hypothetical protein